MFELQNLALCTAALMYILSRDRLNMDLDRSCLELMIKLLEFDQECSAHQDQLTAKEVEKVKEKIRKLCETVHNKHLDLENITVGGGCGAFSSTEREERRPTQTFACDADGPSRHGNVTVPHLQARWRLVQRGTAAAGRTGSYCRQR